MIQEKKVIKAIKTSYNIHCYYNSKYIEMSKSSQGWSNRRATTKETIALLKYAKDRYENIDKIILENPDTKYYSAGEPIILPESYRKAKEELDAICEKYKFILPQLMHCVFLKELPPNEFGTIFKKIMELESIMTPIKNKISAEIQHTKKELSLISFDIDDISARIPTDGYRHDLFLLNYEIKRLEEYLAFLHIEYHKKKISGGNQVFIDLEDKHYD
jgi:DNA polymerase II small subunit/DNA polymerase delta subunit B